MIPRAIQRRTSSALSASNSTWPAAARASAPKTRATVAASPASSSLLPARRFDDRRPGEPEPHAGHERYPLRSARQDRRAAEDVGDTGNEHRNTSGAQIEKRRQRAGERPFGSVGFMQPHAPGCRENDDRGRTLGASELEQAPQRIGMIRARAAAQEPLVLRRDEDMRTIDRRAGDDDAVIVLGRDAPSREMRRRSRRVERGGNRPHASSVGDGGDALRGSERAQRNRRGRAVERHGYRGRQYVNNGRLGIGGARIRRMHENNPGADHSTPANVPCSLRKV